MSSCALQRDIYFYVLIKSTFLHIRDTRLQGQTERKCAVVIYKITTLQPRGVASLNVILRAATR